MPKPPTHPYLYNEANQISITKLKEWEYLKPNQIKTGTITWSRNGRKTGSVSITVNTNDSQPYLQLNYSSNNEPISYKVHLTTVNSNLGAGLIYYFICPHTGKRCRKLYGIGKYFLHREAYTGAMYETQTYSKWNRMLISKFDPYLKRDKLFAKMYSKYFKTHYNGKPTKRYLKILEQLKQAEKITPEDFNRMVSGIY